MRSLPFVLILFCVNVDIAKSDINLDAPIECEVGELVRLDARESNVDSLVWEIIPKTTDFETVNRRAFFSARAPGEYLILIAGAKEGKAFLMHHKLRVVNPLVIPVLAPKPEPSEPKPKPLKPIDGTWHKLMDVLERMDS